MDHVARMGLEIHELLIADLEDFLVDHDLISVFETGWTVLHQHVSMYAAEQLIRLLAGLSVAERRSLYALLGRAKAAVRSVAEITT